MLKSEIACLRGEEITWKNKLEKSESSLASLRLDSHVKDEKLIFYGQLEHKFDNKVIGELEGLISEQARVWKQAEASLNGRIELMAEEGKKMKEELQAANRKLGVQAKELQALQAKGNKRKSKICDKGDSEIKESGLNELYEKVKVKLNSFLILDSMDNKAWKEEVDLQERKVKDLQAELRERDVAKVEADRQLMECKEHLLKVQEELEQLRSQLINQPKCEGVTIISMPETGEKSFFEDSPPIPCNLQFCVVCSMRVTAKDSIITCSSCSMAFHRKCVKLPNNRAKFKCDHCK